MTLLSRPQFYLVAKSEDTKSLELTPSLELKFLMILMKLFTPLLEKSTRLRESPPPTTRLLIWKPERDLMALMPNLSMDMITLIEESDKLNPYF